MNQLPILEVSKVRNYKNGFMLCCWISLISSRILYTGIPSSQRCQPAFLVGVEGNRKSCGTDTEYQDATCQTLSGQLHGLTLDCNGLIEMLPLNLVPPKKGLEPIN